MRTSSKDEPNLYFGVPARVRPPSSSTHVSRKVSAQAPARHRRHRTASERPGASPPASDTVALAGRGRTSAGGPGGTVVSVRAAGATRPGGAAIRSFHARQRAGADVRALAGRTAPGVHHGQSIAIVGAADGCARVRRVLPGTEGASFPFWSPDGQRLGFFAQGKLKTIGLAGGPPQSLCDAISGRGGSWSRDGTILFSESPVSPICVSRQLVAAPLRSRRCLRA